MRDCCRDKHGQRIFLPRILHHDRNDELPFTFVRPQFLVRLPFSVTINKGQGQENERVGIYLPQPVFALHSLLHGKESHQRESFYWTKSRGNNRQNWIRSYYNSVSIYMYTVYVHVYCQQALNFCMESFGFCFFFYSLTFIIYIIYIYMYVYFYPWHNYYDHMTLIYHYKILLLLHYNMRVVCVCVCFLGYVLCTFRYIPSKFTINTAWRSALYTGYFWGLGPEGQVRLGVKVMERTGVLGQKFLRSGEGQIKKVATPNDWTVLGSLLEQVSFVF